MQDGPRKGGQWESLLTGQLFEKFVFSLGACEVYQNCWCFIFFRHRYFKYETILSRIWALIIFESLSCLLFTFLLECGSLYPQSLEHHLVYVGDQQNWVNESAVEYIQEGQGNGKSQWEIWISNRLAEDGPQRETNSQVSSLLCYENSLTERWTDYLG